MKTSLTSMGPLSLSLSEGIFNNKKAGEERLKPSIEQVAFLVAKSAADKLGQDIVVLDLREISSMTDYFVVASGDTNIQVRAIAEGIRADLDEYDITAKRREGWDDARWVLLDYGDIVAHLFTTEEREYYALERLWGDAPRLRLSDDESSLVPAT